MMNISRKDYRPVKNPDEVLVLTGPPAAGKSTVAALIADRWDLSVHLRADYFFEEFIRRGYQRPWRSESQEQNTTVMRAVTAATAEYARGGYLVVVDGIVGPWFVNFVTELFLSHGVIWHYGILLPTSDVCLERNRSRSVEEQVEWEVLDKMYGEFTSHLDGYEKYVVDAAHLNAEQTADAVYKKMEVGELRVR